MEYKKALIIAEQVKTLLAPYCERIEIAGSIRRKKPEVNDIEIVCIPKPYQTDYFNGNKIDRIYECVIKFIQWYNKQ